MVVIWLWIVWFVCCYCVDYAVLFVFLFAVLVLVVGFVCLWWFVLLVWMRLFCWSYWFCDTLLYGLWIFVCVWLDLWLVCVFACVCFILRFGGFPVGVGFEFGLVVVLCCIAVILSGCDIICSFVWILVYFICWVFDFAVSLIVLVLVLLISFACLDMNRLGYCLGFWLVLLLVWLNVVVFACVLLILITYGVWVIFVCLF